MPFPNHNHLHPIRDLNKPLLDPETLGSEIEDFLKQFQTQPESTLIPRYPELRQKRGTIPYVHPRLISFHNEQDKVNWTNYMPDARTRDSFSHFAGPVNTSKYYFKIGVFSVPNGPIIRNQWKTREWHVFVIAIIKARESKGKHILIWDCDPVGVTRSNRWNKILFGKQRTFIKYLRKKRNMGKAHIWYNTDASRGGKGRCLSNSLLKVSEWTRLGDLPYQGIEDVRFQNCVQLQA
ncbi:hypothetical protein F4823DRAFT_638104 [Ustulina deusta]|nr:hypothetical protein F4823DRAFT_638104 [Ustulina deusta]